MAIAVGGGFDDRMFAEIKDACKDMDKGVVWLRADVTKIKEMPPLNDLEAYGEETARRVKRKLGELGLERVVERERRGCISSRECQTFVVYYCRFLKSIPIRFKWIVIMLCIHLESSANLSFHQCFLRYNTPNPNILYTNTITIIYPTYLPTFSVP